MKGIRELLLTGMKRRRKEVSYVSFVALIAVLFLTGITLFQNLMNNYIKTQNLKDYGGWVLSSATEQVSHPYLSREGLCVTGTELVDENGDKIWLYTGYVDENLLEIGNIELYEGHMPQADNEIVVDLYTLSNLGYSYELGQLITINYKDADKNIQIREYVLVGTVKNFANTWLSHERYRLPNILMTANEAGSFGKEQNFTYFYELDKAYEDIDTQDFVLALMNSTENQNIRYNSYAFENGLWESDEVFDYAMYLLIGISAVSVGYLLSVYLGKRRKIYYMYRSMGASKSQIGKFIWTECLYAVVPQILIGLIIPYIVAVIVCKIITLNSEITVDFVFDAGLLLKQIVIVAGVFIFAIILARVGVNDKTLAGNTKEIKPRKYASLRRLAKRTKKPERAFVIRHNRVNFMQHVASILLTIIVSGCMVNYMYKVCYELDNLERINGYSDFSISIHPEYTYKTESATTSFTCFDMYNGITEAMQEELDFIIGIDSMEYAVSDGLHYLDWDKKSESEVINYYHELTNSEDHPLENRPKFSINSNKEEVISLLSDKYLKDMDWDKWKSGEEIIVCFNATTAFFGREAGGESLHDTSMAVGDTVYIKSVNSDILYPVKVGAVSHKGVEEGSLYFNISTYAVIMSEELMYKLAKAEGEIIEYNSIDIDFNSFSSYEATDKQLAAFADKYDMSYDSYSEMKRVAIPEAMRKIASYGAVLLLLTVVYAVIWKNYNKNQNHYRRNQYILMKQLGMSDSQYKKMAFLAEVKKYLWLYAGIPVGYAMLFYIYARGVDLSPSTRSLCRLINDFTQNRWLLAADHLIFAVKHMAIITFVNVLYLVMLANSIMEIRKYMSKEAEHELRVRG